MAETWLNTGNGLNFLEMGLVNIEHVGYVGKGLTYLEKEFEPAGLFYHENELNHSGKSLNYLEKGVNQYGKKVERG